MTITQNTKSLSFKAVEAMKCPILIDQPEDDLDNRAIYLDLVAYLKKKKSLRQVIVATHNPNIVVGAIASWSLWLNRMVLNLRTMMTRSLSTFREVWRTQRHMIQITNTYLSRKTSESMYAKFLRVGMRPSS